MPQATVVEIQRRILPVAEPLHNTATILFQFQHCWKAERRDKREQPRVGMGEALHRRQAGRVCVTKLHPYLIIAEKSL